MMAGNRRLAQVVVTLFLLAVFVVALVFLLVTLLVIFIRPGSDNKTDRGGITGKNGGIIMSSGTVATADEIITQPVIPPVCEDQREVVFLRRFDGSVDFRRGWLDYKVGFGIDGGEFWIGLECLAQLHKSARYQLNVTMTTVKGDHLHAWYLLFTVGREISGYKTRIEAWDWISSAKDGLSGTSQDQRHNVNSMEFSTYDRDNDNSDESCALKHKGGFWYNDCAASNPTGVYGKTAPDGFFWPGNRRGEAIQLKSIAMTMIKQ